MDRFEAMCRMLMLVLMLKGTCCVNGLAMALHLSSEWVGGCDADIRPCMHPIPISVGGWERYR